VAPGGGPQYRVGLLDDASHRAGVRNHLSCIACRSAAHITGQRLHPRERHYEPRPATSDAAVRRASIDKSARIRREMVWLQDAREYSVGAAFYGFARRRRARPGGHVASERHTRPIGIGSCGCGPRAHPSRSSKTWGQHNYTRAIRFAQSGNSDRTFPGCALRRDRHRRRRAAAGPNWSSVQTDG